MRKVQKEITKYVLKKNRDTVYYFDEDGIYKSISLEEAKKMGFINIGPRMDNSSNISGTYRYAIEGYNCTLQRKAISRLKVGDTIEDLEEYLEVVKLEKHNKPEGLDRFITKINKPIFQRVPENHKENTFDYVLVSINIVSRWDEDRKQYINRNIREISRRVIEKIKSNNQFQKYDIPINFLKVTKVTMKNNCLDYILEIREISA